MALILEREGVALTAAERNKRNENLAKIENAINDVSNAVPEAQAAKLLAEEAKAQAIASEEKSANVQEQINQLVVDGDSSVEAAQARVSVNGTSYSTLKDRLDAEQSETAVKLADIAYSMMALKGDGITDDSNAIQAILDAAAVNKVKKVTLPKTDYKVTKPLYVKSNDLELDFSGSKVIWNGTQAINNSSGSLGVLNIHGSVIDGNFLDYFRTLGGSTVQVPPIAAPTLLTMEAVKEFPEGVASLVGSKITTNNNGYFAVGDYIMLVGYTRPEYRPYDPTKYEPELRQLAKIIKKDATHIYTDYYPAFEYPTGFIDNSTVKSRALKVEPIKNIKVKNLKIQDDSAIGTINAPTFAEKEKFVSGVCHALADNVIIENVEVIGHRYPAVFALFSKGCHYKNIKGIKPKMWSGGQGYVIQSIACNTSTFKNIVGEECRHVIDFAWSTYADITNSYGINGKASDFSIHGICEHDLKYVKCKGSASIGHGIEYFPEMQANILFEDFKGRINSSPTSYIENVKFKNCKELVLNNLPPAIDIVIKESIIDYFFGSKPVANKRGRSKKSSFKFKDNDVTFKQVNISAPSQTVGVSGYDFVEIGVNEFDFAFDPLVLPACPTFLIENSIDNKVYGNTYSQLSFTYSSLSKRTVNFDLSDNKSSFLSQSGVMLITMKNLTETTVQLKLKDNTLNHNGSFGYATVIYMDDTAKVNSSVIAYLHDNLLLGNPNASIRHSIASTNDPAKVTTIAVDRNNIVRNKHIDSIFNANENVFI